MNLLPPLPLLEPGKKENRFATISQGLLQLERQGRAAIPSKVASPSVLG